MTRKRKNRKEKGKRRKEKGERKKEKGERSNLFSMTDFSADCAG
jgi:hypothetical protein